MTKKIKKDVQFKQTLQAGEELSINFRDDATTDLNGVETRPLSPFKNLTIISEGTKINYKINGQRSGEDIPAGTIRTREDLVLNNITIKNIGSTSTDITVQVNNDDTELSLLKKINEKLSL